MDMGGISIWQLLILLVIVVLLIGTKRIFKATKSVADKVSSIVEQDSASFDDSEIQFLSDSVLSQGNAVVSEETIPLNNLHGQRAVSSEHEFSRTITTSLTLNKQQTKAGHIKASIWSLLESEIRTNVSKTLGIQIGDQITRKVVVKLEAGPGENVIYKIVWQQNQRKGLANISVGSNQLGVPYETTYGLFHSIESRAG